MAKRSVLFIAGEASADAHAAAVLRALAAHDPELQAFGMGGAACAAAGLEILVPARCMALAGLTEVLWALPRVFGYMRLLLAACRARGPKVAVLVDLPDFNLRLAKKLKAMGVYVIYYVSPQVWAWREGRVATLRAVVDELLVILPFEEPYFRRHGVAAQFVGHPLLEELEAHGGVPSQRQARQTLGLAAEQEVLALLPGSRRKEVARLLPAMLAGAARLQQERPGLQVVLPIASTIAAAQVQRLVQQSAVKIRLVAEQSTCVLAACDAAVVCSGTATLQAALVGRPMVVVYRVSWLTFFVLRRLVRVAHVGLVNLVANERLVPELLQGAVSATNIAGGVRAWLTNAPKRRGVLTKMRGLRATLSSRRPAQQVARAVLAQHRAPLSEGDA